jgi:hypothetical protein
MYIIVLHPMRIISGKSLLFLIAVTHLSSFASAAILLDLDFDHNKGTWGRTTDQYGTTVLSTDNVDSNNHFNLGTTNIYARWVDASNNQPRSASAAFAPGEGLSLKLTTDLWIQSNSGPYKALLGFFSGSTLTTHPTDNQRVAGANLQNLTVQTHYQISLYYNGATETLSFYNPVTGLTQSLEQYQSAAFAYEVQTDSWLDISMNSSNSQGPIERIGLYNNAGYGAQSNIFFDNLKVISVPEPSSWALYTAASGVLIVLTRRRLRRAQR